jgi:hypothetical protein
MAIYKTSNSLIRGGSVAATSNPRMDEADHSLAGARPTIPVRRGS